MESISEELKWREADLEHNLTFVRTFQDFVGKVNGVKEMLLAKEYDDQTRFVVVGGTSIAVEDIVSQLNGENPVGFLDAQEILKNIWPTKPGDLRVFHIEIDYEEKGDSYKRQLEVARATKKAAIERLFMGHAIGEHIPNKAAILLALENGLPAYTTTAEFLSQFASLEGGALLHDTARQVEGALMPQSSPIEPSRLRPILDVLGANLTSDVNLHLDLPEALLREIPFVLFERALMGHPISQSDAEQIFCHDQKTVGADVPLNPLFYASFAGFYLAPLASVSSAIYLGGAHPASLPILAVGLAGMLASGATHLATLRGFDPTLKNRHSDAEATRKNTIIDRYLSKFQELELHFGGLRQQPLGVLWLHHYRLTLLQKFRGVEVDHLEQAKATILALSQDGDFTSYVSTKGPAHFEMTDPQAVMEDFKNWKKANAETSEVLNPIRPMPNTLKA